MANWQGVAENLESGFNIGQKVGGKLSGLGAIIGKVADRLRSQRETGEATTQALDLLGKTEKIKSMYGEYKPRTQEEALNFETAKAGITTNQPQPIVNEKGETVGSRPKGSVFAPSGTSKELTLSNAMSILSDPMKASQLKRQYPNLYAKAEQVVRDNLGEEALINPNAPKKLPKPKVKGSNINTITEDNLMDTNW